MDISIKEEYFQYQHIQDILLSFHSLNTVKDIKCNLLIVPFSSWYPLSHKQLGIFILKFPLHSEQLDFVFTQLPQIELHSWQEFDDKSRNLA
jgi:hypothetical protein